MNNVPEYQKAELLNYLQEKQIRDSLMSFNELTERCFDKCAMTGWGGNFTSKHLSQEESKCLTNCAEKYLKAMQRSGYRFTEFQNDLQQQYQNQK